MDISLLVQLKCLCMIAKSHTDSLVANGAPDGTLAAGSTARDILDAIDWVFANAGKGQFAAVDPSQLAAAGRYPT